MTPSVSGRIQDAFSSRVVPFFREELPEGLANAAKKSIEAGVEAATLSAIHDSSPEAAFGVAAGAQAVESLGLFLITHPKSALTTFGTAWLASESLKAVGPGDQDLFASKDFAVQKLVGGILWGSTSALLGGGRLRGEAAERLPEFFDAITAVPRGAVHSLIQQVILANDEGNKFPQLVLDTVVRNPNAFNRDQLNSLMRAANSERPGAFNKEVQRLLDDSEDFRNRLDEAVGSRRPKDTPADRLNRLTPTHSIQRY